MPVTRNSRQSVIRASDDRDLVLLHERDHDAHHHDLVGHCVHQLAEVRDEAAGAGEVAVEPVAHRGRDEEDERQRRRAGPRANT
jgi:hypothetical protein